MYIVFFGDYNLFCVVFFDYLVKVLSVDDIFVLICLCRVNFIF